MDQSSIIQVFRDASLNALDCFARDLIKERLPTDYIQTLNNNDRTDALRACLIIYYVLTATAMVPHQFQLEAVLATLSGHWSRQHYNRRHWQWEDDMHHNSYPTSSRHCDHDNFAISYSTAVLEFVLIICTVCLSSMMKNRVEDWRFRGDCILDGRIKIPRQEFRSDRVECPSQYLLHRIHLLIDYTGDRGNDTRTKSFHHLSATT
ncbi:hypothetical protein BDR05DRAFT_4283 [Suillus weaverae]|nr:hypothetical protein BDR05DRAFT_4283 [Suillus weaverae]